MDEVLFWEISQGIYFLLYCCKQSLELRQELRTEFYKAKHTSQESIKERKIAL